MPSLIYARKHVFIFNFSSKVYLKLPYLFVVGSHCVFSFNATAFINSSCSVRSL